MTRTSLKTNRHGYPQIDNYTCHIVEYTRLVWFFAVMGAFATIYQLGSMSEITESEAELVMAEFEDLVDDIDAFGIFLHNTTIALLMFIPGFGMIWGSFSAWSTGFVFAAITFSMPDVEGAIPTMPLALLFLTPFGLLEICAYSLGMSRSLILLVTIIKRQSLLVHLKGTIIEIGIVVVLLLVGGYVEFFMIEELLEHR